MREGCKHSRSEGPPRAVLGHTERLSMSRIGRGNVVSDERGYLQAVTHTSSAVYRLCVFTAHWLQGAPSLQLCSSPCCGACSCSFAISKKGLADEDGGGNTDGAQSSAAAAIETRFIWQLNWSDKNLEHAWHRALSHHRAAAAAAGSAGDMFFVLNAGLVLAFVKGGRESLRVLFHEQFERLRLLRFARLLLSFSIVVFGAGPWTAEATAACMCV